ncbi:hypothetical protein A2960_02855 [Candidatus Gottesmanbacteria bacterium RIFCSPLOWO2_01_FULL_39_12b]|uniref:Uncharacterized protein n=1 Tax=Candidatus Gottesmanbacteria bacterium RIFCSPLOWO2_01_FULL_39_12b TaxID=1798388 RepID=A0A1F6AQW9_9BACT|nr:MAG: hypothetical protein A2960_02855 [Candidatus Gottesmanbacteria bacterium RIFCSPLOWO2_01_FULL_39_12b]
MSYINHLPGGLAGGLSDTSFKFPDHPLMPKTTNELEGSISVLSRKHNLHKGLKRERVKPFLSWLIYFYNRKILSQRKNLRVGKTNTKF